jgi:hypothetical protein
MVSLGHTRARELQAEYFVDEMMDIADDGRNDFMQRARDNGDVFVDADREHLLRSKIRIETRQWVIERILSAKYGKDLQPQVVVNNQQLNVTTTEVDNDTLRRVGVNARQPKETCNDSHEEYPSFIVPVFAASFRGTMSASRAHPDST